MSDVPGRLLVKVHPGTSLDDVAAAFAEVEVNRELAPLGIYVLTVHEQDVGAMTAELEAHPVVAYVERDTYDRCRPCPTTRSGPTRAPRSPASAWRLPTTSPPARRRW